MVVSRIEVEQFRMLNNQSFELGENLTAIIGQNGTMKSTLLGMIGEPFRYRIKDPNSGMPYKTIDEKLFELKFSDAFKFSDGPSGFERAGNHSWKAQIDKAVYPDGEYQAVTIPRTNIEKNDIRTWSGKGKGKGQKHVQFPVIYLSLKRLVPIGEEHKVEHGEIDLDGSEKRWFEKYHKQILLLSHSMTSAEYVKSSNKATIGFVTDRYDSLTNSAGQDNVGKILMAILSFSRLKNQLGDAYQGGLLLIDEIDATLYPAAQKKLIEALMKFSRDLSLQIIFTTHSADAIDVIYDRKYQLQCKALYLETRDAETKIYENLPYKNALAHLRAEIAREETRKILVFTEDDSARIFAKKLLPADIKKRLNFVNVSLSHGELNNLRKVGLEDFVNGILIFDGDVDVNSRSYKAKNAIALPGKVPPEQVFFKFLKGLDEGDDFWDAIPGGYTKQICFAGYEVDDGKDVGKTKRWFDSQKSNFGRGCTKLIKRWKDDNADALEKFQTDLRNAFESVGGKV